MAVFHVEQNHIIDLNPACPLPDLPLSSAFASSYLTHRTRPPFRPTPRTPYSTYDVIVHGSLPSPTTAQSLLDHLSLFPTLSTQNLLTAASSITDLTTAVTRLVTSISHGLKQSRPNFEAIAHLLHTLYSLSANSPEGAGLVIAQLSPRNDKLGAIDRVRAWARDARAASSSSHSPGANGITWPVCADGLTAALINTLIGIPPAERGEGRVELRLKVSQSNPVDDDDAHALVHQLSGLSIDTARAAIRECGGVVSALRKLQEGWRPDLKVGKRGTGRRRQDIPKAVGKMDSFGEQVDVEWIKRRVAADAAREEMEAELQQEEDDRVNAGENAGADQIVEAKGEDIINLAGGVYDDEPDEGVLAGEISLMGLRDIDDESDGDDDTSTRERIFTDGNRARGGTRGISYESNQSIFPRGPGIGMRRSGRGNAGFASSSSNARGGPPSEQPAQSVSGPGAEMGSRGRGARGRGRGQNRGRGRGRGGNRGRARGDGRRDRAAQKQSRGM